MIFVGVFKKENTGERKAKNQNAAVCWPQRSAAGSILRGTLFSAEDSGRFRTFPDTTLLFRLLLFPCGLLLLWLKQRGIFAVAFFL
jgi:hypothetical protein